MNTTWITAETVLRTAGIGPGPRAVAGVVMVGGAGFGRNIVVLVASSGVSLITRVTQAAGSVTAWVGTAARA
jgi:hypothetical protein